MGWTTVCASMYSPREANPGSTAGRSAAGCCDNSMCSWEANGDSSVSEESPRGGAVSGGAVIPGGGGVLHRGVKLGGNHSRFCRCWHIACTLHLQAVAPRRRGRKRCHSDHGCIPPHCHSDGWRDCHANRDFDVDTRAIRIARLQPIAHDLL